MNEADKKTLDGIARNKGFPNWERLKEDFLEIHKTQSLHPKPDDKIYLSIDLLELEQIVFASRLSGEIFGEEEERLRCQKEIEKEKMKHWEEMEIVGEPSCDCAIEGSNFEDFCEVIQRLDNVKKRLFGGEIKEWLKGK